MAYQARFSLAISPAAERLPPRIAEGKRMRKYGTHKDHRKLERGSASVLPKGAIGPALENSHVDKSTATASVSSASRSVSTTASCLWVDPDSTATGIFSSSSPPPSPSTAPFVDPFSLPPFL